jgi:hypothetical protein
MCRCLGTHSWACIPCMCQWHQATRVLTKYAGSMDSLSATCRLASKKACDVISRNNLPVGRTIVQWHPPFVFDAVQHEVAHPHQQKLIKRHTLKCR